MSTPDPNPKPSSVTIRPVTTTTPITQPNTTLKTPSSQPQPSYPSYRVTAPFQRHHPQPNPYPIRRIPNPQQDLSGRGFQTRPGRAHPVSNDPVGYPPRPVYSYNQGQFGSGLDPMVQFVRAHPYIQQAAQLGSAASGPMKGVPHFLQPRVAHPTTTTSILESNVHKTARKRDDVLVLVRKRKVRLTEGASLYSLCRSWLRNGAHEGIQRQQNYTMTSLPKPLPVEITETSLPKDSLEEPNHEEDKEDEEAVKELSESDLLKRHVDRAKKVRSRLREERLKKIARYKARLALLLPPFGEQCKNE